MAELSQESPAAEDVNESRDRELRVQFIMNRFLFMLKNPHESAPRSHHHDRSLDPSKASEWKTNVTMATKRAAQKLGSWTWLHLAERLADREPLRDSTYVYAVYLFVEEVKWMNREGCPDDYEMTWGKEAAEIHERAAAVRLTVDATERKVGRTVQATEMTA